MITQEQINTWRKKVAVQLVINSVKRGEPYVPIHYVWFPENRHTKVELREGNPPADSDRPNHLRNMKLYVGDCHIYPPLRDFILEMVNNQNAYGDIVDEVAIQKAAYERLARESNIYTL